MFYSFPAAVRGIIRESSQYARLQKQVMFAFSSKYALALYEMVQKRGNLKFKTSEEFPVDRFRSLLGVEAGKLKEFKNFKLRAIDPAVLEVNGLGEFGCKVEPVYSGRKAAAVRLSWWAKNLDERKDALNELQFSRVGRRARLKGEVVTILSGLLPTPSQDVAVGATPKLGRSAHPKMLPSNGRNGLTETQSARFRRDFAGLDVPWLEREFREWLADRDPPDDYAAAFYGFMKRKKAEME